MADHVDEIDESCTPVTILPTIFIAAAATVIISAMIAGALSFSPPRAIEVRRHETTTPEQAAPATNPKIIVVPQRMDRHDYYIGVLIALWFAGVGVVLVPIGTGALASLAGSTQKLLALALILGSSLSLLGASLGPPSHFRWFNPMRWWFPEFKEGYAYGIGAGGQFCIGVALGFFGWTVLVNGSLIGSITGLLTPILSICAFRTGRRLWAEHKRLDAEWWKLKRAAEGDQ